MLDIKSKLVLKILAKECPNGSFKIVESKDIISAMPNKYRVDNDGLDNILIYLERQEYISIKYDDDGIYCLCVLPFGDEILESTSQKNEWTNSPRLWKLSIMMFLSSLLASLLALLLGYFIWK